MKPADSFSVSYVLCRHPVIPVPSPDCTRCLLALRSRSVCAGSKPGLGKAQLLLLQSSPVLSGWEQPQLQDALGESVSGVMSEDSKSGITLLFQAMPGTVTLNKALHQLLRYRPHCARRSWDALILSQTRGCMLSSTGLIIILDYFFPYLTWMLYPRTMKIHKAHCYKILHS